MRLSEKYFFKITSPSGKGRIDNEIQLYGRICKLEGMLELAREHEDVIHPSLISKWTEELNEISKKENL